MPSVSLPNTGRKEFQKIAVRIAEIYARAASRPMDAALDVDGVSSEMRLPGGQVDSVDRKRDVESAGSIMWGNGSTGKFGRSSRTAASKQQKDVFTGNIERTKALLFDQRIEAHYGAVKALRPIEVVNIEGGFLQIAQAWCYGHF